MLPGLTLPASWRVLLETFRPRSPVVDVGISLSCWPPAWSRVRPGARWSACSPGRAWRRWCRFHACCRFLLGACLGCRSARPGAGAADRDQAARRGRADRGGHRRRPVPPLGPAGVRASRPATVPRKARPRSARQPVDHRWDRRRVAVPLASGVPAGPVSALAQHGRPSRCGWLASDFRSAAAVSGSDHPRRGRRRLHGKVLLVENTTFAARLPVNAVLYAPAPPRTGERRRPG